MKSTNINKNLIILQEFKRATLLSGAEKLLNEGDFRRFSRLLLHYESKLNEKQWTSEIVYERFLKVLEYNDIIFEAAPRTPAPMVAPSGASDDEVREIMTALQTVHLAVDSWITGGASTLDSNDFVAQQTKALELIARLNSIQKPAAQNADRQLRAKFERAVEMHPDIASDFKWKGPEKTGRHDDRTRGDKRADDMAGAAEEIEGEQEGVLKGAHSILKRLMAVGGAAAKKWQYKIASDIEAIKNAPPGEVSGGGSSIAGMSDERRQFYLDMYEKHHGTVKGPVKGAEAGAGGEEGGEGGGTNISDVGDKLARDLAGKKFKKLTRKKYKLSWRTADGGKMKKKTTVIDAIINDIKQQLENSGITISEGLNLNDDMLREIVEQRYLHMLVLEAAPPKFKKGILNLTKIVKRHMLDAGIDVDGKDGRKMQRKLMVKLQKHVRQALEDSGQKGKVKVKYKIPKKWDPRASAVTAAMPGRVGLRGSAPTVAPVSPTPNRSSLEESNDPNDQYVEFWSRYMFEEIMHNVSNS